MHNQPRIKLDLPPGGALTLTEVLAGTGASPKEMVLLPPTCCVTFVGTSPGVGTGKLVLL
jgi:hypothetical protein